MSEVRTSCHGLVAVCALALLALTCNFGPTNQDEQPASPEMNSSVSEAISAEQGGRVEHPRGAELVVAPGAISQDTTVTIIDLGYEQPAQRAPGPFLDLSHRYRVDLGEAQARGEIALELEMPVETPFDIAPNHILLRRDDREGNGWLHNGDFDDERNVFSRSVDDLLNASDMQSVTLTATALPDVTITAETPPILDVPYYLQDGLSWCTPTALAMLLNYHGQPLGVTSNYAIAGQVGIDRDVDGYKNYTAVEDLGLSDEQYEFFYWSDDLISWPDPDAGDPDNPNLYLDTPFTSYVQLQIQGFDLADYLGDRPHLTYDDAYTVAIESPIISFPPRPIQLTADTENHAFVAVGADDETVWLHDSSGAFSPRRVAEPMSWEDFKAAAFEGADDDYLRSIVINTDQVRPMEERVGSLVLRQSGERGFTYTDSDSALTSQWRWDGVPYERGYFWNDPMGALRGDSSFGGVFPSSSEEFGTLEYKFKVANITATTRTYQVTLELRNEGSELDRIEHELAVPARTWVSQSLQGSFDTSRIGVGDHQIVIRLLYQGILQEERVIEFTVREDISLTPLPSPTPTASPTSSSTATPTSTRTRQPTDPPSPTPTPSRTPTPTPEPSSEILGVVFEDENGNGALDAGEGRLAGVDLTLRSGSCSGSVAATRTTGSQGAYAIGGLAAGDYCLQLDESTLPPGPDHWVAQNANPRQFALGQNEARTDLHFGYVPVTQ